MPHQLAQQEILKHLTPNEQVLFALSHDWKNTNAGSYPAITTPRIQKALALSRDDWHTDERGLVGGVLIEERLKVKAAVPAATTANSPDLVYPSQAAGVLLPPVTPSLIAALKAGGAPEFPPNTRVLTQSALLSAAEVAEGQMVPAAAPDIEFRLTSTDRKFGLILTFNSELVSVGNLTPGVVAYVQGQLEAAANNATDEFLVNLLTTAGTAATSVAAAIAGFAGDLRSAVWIGSPGTLAGLQDAANPNIGPNGGLYRNLPALPSLAAPSGKLFLVDRRRIALFDGPQTIERSTEANIVLDSAPGSATSPAVSMFQENQVALKVVKYADAALLSTPTVVSL